MKERILNFMAGLWFFGILMWTLLFGVLALLMISFCDIAGMLNSGFSKSAIGLIICFLLGMILTLTGAIPVFRKCYYKLPWLYPFSMMLSMDLFIVSIAETILAKGFSVISTPRHTITIAVMVVQLIVCRLAMCAYLKKYPMAIHQYDRLE